MKKIRILAILLMVFLLAGCGDNEVPQGTDSGNVTTADAVGSTEQTTAAGEQNTEPVDLSNWGRTDQVATQNGEHVAFYEINVPKYLGSTYWGANISEQPGKMMAFVSGQNSNMEYVEQVSDIFNAYMENTIASLENFYGMRAKNFVITVSESTPVTIGDYEMYVHKGIITYDFKGSQRTHQFVAYATKLKNGGNSAYWMMYDYSADQSNGETIAEYALNMAKTFKEVD